MNDSRISERENLDILRLDTTVEGAHWNRIFQHLFWQAVVLICFNIYFYISFPRYFYIKILLGSLPILLIFLVRTYFKEKTNIQFIEVDKKRNVKVNVLKGNKTVIIIGKLTRIDLKTNWVGKIRIPDYTLELIIDEKGRICQKTNLTWNKEELMRIHKKIQEFLC